MTRLRLLVGTILVVLSGAAAAQCAGNSRTVHLPLPATITPASNAATGDLLTSWIQSAAISNYFSCSAPKHNGVRGDFSSSTISNVRIWSPDMGAQIRVWQTNVSGIGVAVIHRGHNGGCSWSNWEDSEAGGACTDDPPTNIGSQVKVALVKIGPVTAGTIQNMTVMQAVPIGGHNLDPISSKRISFVIGGISILTPTCAVTNSPVTVRLAPVDGLPLKTFTGNNSSSTPVPFELRLNCSNNPTVIRIAFTDTSNPANKGNILQLTPDSSAAGLGVQILNNDSPIRFGPAQSKSGAEGQIRPDAATGRAQAFTVPLTARYIQTRSTVRPGTANARASFTISYQ